MSDATDPSEQRPPPQHRSPHPENHEYPDYPDYYKRGPTLLASRGDVS